MQTDPLAQVVAPAGLDEAVSTESSPVELTMLLTPADTAALAPHGSLGVGQGGDDGEQSAERRELGHFAGPGLERVWDPGVPLLRRGRYILARQPRRALAGTEHHVEHPEYPANTRADGAERRRGRSVVDMDAVERKSWDRMFTRPRSIVTVGGKRRRKPARRTRLLCSSSASVQVRMVLADLGTSHVSPPPE